MRQRGPAEDSMMLKKSYGKALTIFSWSVAKEQQWKTPVMTFRGSACVGAQYCPCGSEQESILPKTKHFFEIIS